VDPRSYLTSRAYIEYSGNLTEFKKIPNGLTFNTFYYRTTTHDGTCPAWKTFTDEQLLLPFEDIQFTSLHSYYSVFDYTTHTSKFQTATCSNVFWVQTFIRALQTRSEAEFNCNGVSWRVFQCNGNPIICNNCKKICVNTEACAGASFVTNPCQQNCHQNSGAGGIVTFQYSYTVLYPQFKIVPAVVSTARTSVTIKFAVDKPGSVYCAAFAGSTPTTALNATTLVDINNKGTFTQVRNVNLTYTATIPGLMPDSPYTVACYTQDDASHIMKLQVAKLNAFVVTTACCRDIAFSGTHASILAATTATASSPVFSFELSSIPRAPVTVNLTITAQTCTGTSASLVPSVRANQTHLVPRSFRFLAGTTALKGSFLVLGYQGCYSITSEFFTTDSYNSPAINVVIVNPALDPLPAPTILSAEFSNDGGKLIAKFSSDTNQPSPSTAVTFPCSYLLTFADSATATCKWNATNSLIISLPASPLTIPTNTLIVKGGLLRAPCVVTTTNCSSYPYLATTSVIISGPSSAAKPSASLIAPRTVSYCADVTLDATQSRGNGGRKWVSVTWSASSAELTAANLTAIVTYLNANAQDVSYFVTVPNRLLAISRAPVSITFTLALVNFFGQSSVSSSTVSFDYVSGSMPSVSIYRLQNAAFYRWQPLNLFSTVRLSSCGNISSVPMSYKWSTYRGAILQTQLVSTSLDPRFIRLPAFSLEAGTNYTFQVQASVVTVTGRTVTGTASLGLITGRSGVVAAIAGGSAQTVSTSLPIVLDASASYSIDYPTSSVLTYSWSCTLITSNFGASCYGFVPPGNVARWTTPANYLRVDTHAVTVTVTDAFGQSSSVTVQLSVVEPVVSLVSISPVQRKYNVGNKIIINARVNASLGPVTASWSSPSLANFNTNKLILTPLLRSLPRGSTLYPLSFLANTLTVGLSYTFILQATYLTSGAVASTSAVTIVANEPPSGGVLTISPPQNGVALKTVYDFKTAYWTDDEADFPISYILSYYVLSPNNQNIIKSSDTVQYASSVLAQGLVSQAFKVTGVANASDVYGSYAVATATAEVFAVTPALGQSVAAAVSVASAAAFKQAFQSQNAAQVTQIVDAALGSINTIDCTVPVSCAALNRAECRYTPKTCGACNVGFAGPSGDSNVLCSSAASVVLPVGASCSSNSSCVTNICSAGKCQDISKKCIDSCNGNGVCILMDVNQNIVSKCSILDRGCSASCVCSASRYGRSCQLTLVRYNELVSLRESLCVNIYKTLALQDVSLDVVRSRAESIGNALIDIDQISNAAVQNCTEALVTTLIAHPTLACEGSSSPLITNALSNVLQKRTLLSEDLFERLSTAAVSFASGCQDNTAVGETPLELISQNLRMTTAMLDPDAAAGYVLPAAQDAFEILAQVPNPSVTLGSDATTGSSGASSAIGVSLVQWMNNPRGAVINSTSLVMQSTQYEDAESLSSRRRLTIPDAATFSFAMTLPNISPINYFERKNATIAVYCERRSDVTYYMNATCPGEGGIDVSILCPAVTRGYFNITCPGRRALPLCTVWNGAMYVENPNCKVVSFNAFNTTCECTGTEAQRRRYLQAGDSTTTQEFSSTFDFFDDPYSQIFVTYPGLLQVRRNEVIFATLWAVVGILVLGLFGIGYWDKNELVEIDKLKGKKTHAVRTIQGFFNTVIPDEFRPGPWKELLIKRMMLEHSWLSVFGPYHEKKGFRMSKWALAMGKLLTYVLVASIVASVIFADNGFCERFDDEDSCTNERSFAGVLHSCAWNPDNVSCIFRRPEVEFTTILLFVIVVAVIAAPVSHLVEILLKRLFRLLRNKSAQQKARSNTVAVAEIDLDDEVAEHKDQKDRNELKEYWHLNDELRDIQTTRTKWLKASRLRKQQKTADFALPTAETEFLMQSADDHLGDYGRRELTINSANFATMASSPTVQHDRYAMYASSKRKLLKNVQLARRRADYIRAEMEYMQNNEQREEFLIKHFVVDAFKGHERNIAARYFLGSIQSTKRTRVSMALRYLSLLLLPAIFAVMIYFVIFFNFDIGSRATDLWLFVVFITLLEDIFFLQPLKIWLNWVVINSYVSAEAFKICVALKLRFSSIMNRRFGVMRDANSLIQHFNPACRAARLFPHLPVARFLMSMNDYDVPKFAVEPSYYHYSEPHRSLARANIAIVTLLTRLPFSVQDTIVDIFGTVSINLLAIAFYLLGKLIMGLAIALVVLLFLVIWLRETKYLDRLRKKKTVVDFKKYLPPPTQRKVVPVEVVQKINDDFDNKVLFKSQFKALDEHEALKLGSTPRQNQDDFFSSAAISPHGSVDKFSRKSGSTSVMKPVYPNNSSPYLPNESLNSMGSFTAQSKNSRSPNNNSRAPRGGSGAFATPNAHFSQPRSASPNFPMLSPIHTASGSAPPTIGGPPIMPAQPIAKSVMTALSLQNLHDLELGTDEETEKAELKALRRAARKSKKRHNRMHSLAEHSAVEGRGGGAYAGDDGMESVRPSQRSEDENSETSAQRDARRRYKRRKDRFGHKESDTGGPGISSARRFHSSAAASSGEEKGELTYGPGGGSIMSVSPTQGGSYVGGQSSILSKTSQFPTWH